MIQRYFSEANIENLIEIFFEFFDILTRNIHCGYTLEPPHRGGSNEDPQCMFWIKKKEK